MHYSFPVISIAVSNKSFSPFFLDISILLVVITSFDTHPESMTHIFETLISKRSLVKSDTFPALPRHGTARYPFFHRKSLKFEDNLKEVAFDRFGSIRFLT